MPPPPLGRLLIRRSHQGLDHDLQVLHRMVQVHDLDGAGKMVASEFFQARTAVDEQDNVFGTEEPAPDGFAPQPNAKVRGALKASEIGRRVVVAQGPALLVFGVLGEDAREMNHAGFGLALRGFARPARNFLSPHRHPGGIRADVEGLLGITAAGE
jgi:hypothetical protein